MNTSRKVKYKWYIIEKEIIQAQQHKQINKAKKLMLEEQCEELEEIQRKHVSFNVHKMIIEITYSKTKSNQGLFKDTRGKKL